MPQASQRTEAVDFRARAFELIKARSFGRKKIILASGRESDFYFDMKPTMFHPEGAYCLAELIIARLRDVTADYVGGVAVGAVPLVAAVTALSFTHGRPLPGFFVRKEAKDHGTRKLVDGVESLQGQSVVILEDVTTTGGSSMIAVEAVRKSGGTVALVLSMVDRQEGAEDTYRAAQVPFDSLFKAEEFLNA
jgi:orotate phosphoribosyltransferase